tara:strand:- start:952 stop:1599 length:648 start_codon:yes stop_codon:yes gene_type:complete
MHVRNEADITINGFQEGESIKSFFGPLMGHTRMTDKTVDSLLSIFNDLPPDHPDSGDYLAGQIKHQPKMPFEAVEILTTELGGFIHNFIQTQGNIEKSNVVDAWYVEQRTGEYNPMHAHSFGDAVLSCVGYLAIPEDLEKLWEKSKNSWQDRTNDGVIQFLYGNMGEPERGSQVFWPQVGEFYIFPAFLLHTVYPFKCVGSRISFSMNIEKTNHD